MRSVLVFSIIFVALSIGACSSEPKTKEYFMKDISKAEAFLKKNCSGEKVLKDGFGGKLHKECESAKNAIAEIKHIKKNSIGGQAKTQEYYDANPEEADKFYETRCSNMWMLDPKLELKAECDKVRLTYNAKWKRGRGIKSQEYYDKNIEEAKAFRKEFCNDGMRMPGLDNIYGELLDECNKVDKTVNNERYK